MTLFKIETQSDSELIEIDTDDKELIKEMLKEYLKNRDYYYVDALLTHLKEKGFKIRKMIPIKINWWEIQPVREMEQVVEKILKSE